MLQERLAAAYTVRDTILPLKKQTSQLATEMARGVVTLRDARAAANLKIGTGLSAIAKIDRAAACLAEAEQLIVDAHIEMAPLIAETGLTRFYQSDFGDDDATPNNVTAPSGSSALRVVGVAA